MIDKIHYLVGPNGTGKTRALNKLCSEQNGLYIPKQRVQVNLFEFNDTQSVTFIREFRLRSKSAPENIAMALLRENANLRYTVFQILSRKLGRNFSVEIVERSQNFKITSGLDDESYENISIPRYDLRGESAGLRELLILLTLINSGLSTKYFIDEPELSLHPEAQRFLKNEMVRLAVEKGIEFCLATHSPIFFAPESIEELQQATFFSDPQKENGEKPDFTAITPGQKLHLEKSLLRLDSEKWLLVHSKGVIFCEGFRDKVIFKKVLEKCGIDISRSDFSIVETGGKDDFSTLHLLCTAINKPSFYIGDLDNLLESKLLDKFNSNPIVTKAMEGIASDIQQYISTNIKENLGLLIEALLKVELDTYNSIDVDRRFLPYLERIRKKTDNSKSLTLEIILKFPDLTKQLLNDSKFNSKIDLLIASVKKAITTLAEAGFLIIDSGSLETFYQSSPVSPDDDKEKIKLFDTEFELLKTEDKAITEIRYKKIIDFTNSIIKDNFDSKKYITTELTKILSRLQAIIIEERPDSPEALISTAKYKELKITDLLSITELLWNKQTFSLKVESVKDFLPQFEINFSSDKGITSSNIITIR